MAAVPAPEQPPAPAGAVAPEEAVPTVVQAAVPDTLPAPAVDAAPSPAIADPAPAPAADDAPDPGLSQVKFVEPDFPADLVRRLHKGNVEVRFQVDPDGAVVDTAVVESSHSHLNRAAQLAIKQWRFKPTAKAHVALVNLVFDDSMH